MRPFVEEISRSANTLVFESRTRWSAHSTDGPGLARDLTTNLSLDLAGRRICVVGAGGAARAIGYGLISDGAHVTVLNRSMDKGERLATDLGADFIPLAEDRSYRCHILINTTPMGMLPYTETTPVEKRNLEKEMVVMDIVYNPLKTRLLREAEELGCTVIDGTGMFVHQGALQFELWTGKDAPIPVMKQAVMEALIND